MLSYVILYSLSDIDGVFSVCDSHLDSRLSQCHHPLDPRRSRYERSYIESMTIPKPPHAQRG